MLNDNIITLDNNISYYILQDMNYDGRKFILAAPADLANDTLNTEELVNKRETSISLISPNSLLTNQTAHNYDDEGTIIIAPKVAILDKERRFADRKSTRLNSSH